jgi:hypothetical protein
MAGTTFFVVAEPGAATLHEVALKVFAAWGVEKWEERFSANYPPDEHYFAGYTINAKITIFDCDVEELPLCPFCIRVGKPSRRTGPGSLQTESPALARQLSAAGLSIFVPHGAWYRKDWDGAGESYPA